MPYRSADCSELQSVPLFFKIADIEPIVSRLECAKVSVVHVQERLEAAAIVVELSSYPLYAGQPSFADVHDQLDKLGFVFRGTIDQMLSPKDGRILQFDGLFENQRPDALPQQNSHAVDR